MNTMRAGVLLLAVLALSSLLGPWLVGHAPDAVSVEHMLAAPSADHWLGTDMLGRDVLSRLVSGGRMTLLVGIGVVALAFAIGVTLGLVAGLVGGALDWALMRLVDALLSFPALVLAIALAAAFGPSLAHAMLAVALGLAPHFARLARAQAQAMGHALHVEAARAAGVPPMLLLGRYYLRGALPTLVTQASLSLGTAILQVAALGFLGLGAQPPLAEWGADISASLDCLRSAPWVAAAPGAAIFLAVLAFNLMADGLNAASDHRG
jgi:peptide/nickel transport system permease protein